MITQPAQHQPLEPVEKFTGELSTTFREYILLPRCTRSETDIRHVSMQTRISHDMALQIPLMSAAMEAVSGATIATALARHGGMAVLPAGNVPLEHQLEELKAVKRFKAGFVESVITVTPDTPLHQLLEMETRHGFSTFPVVDQQGKLVGLITEKKYHPSRDADLVVRERMIPLEKLVVGRHGISLSEANDRIFESGIGVLPIIDEEGKLRSVVFFRDLKHHHLYPDALVDEHKRLRVAAAISTHPEDRERARLLVDCGADVLVVDASDGYSEYMRDTLVDVKKLGVPVVAGNVVDRDGFRFLAENGADAVKVGIGSGSICTTRRVKAIGRGQATAVSVLARAREEYLAESGRYVPIISDGGIESTGDMAVALATGADVLMMGKYFAGFEESPTQLLTKRLPVLFSGNMTEVEVNVKPYWGEASPRAKNVRRYQQDDPRAFVIEGEEGYVLYKGSLHKHLPRDLRALQGTLSSCGCRNLREFYRYVRLERQSAGSQQEGGTNIFRM
ncbi:MAG: IMP dehydrogenase [Armatimonadetes bacterium]|nr:IMP dehydrogenase [Armatimonadota bacterium]